MLQYAVPPGYQRQQPIKRPKLGPWLGVIGAILNDDKQRPVKQRHTSKRIFERLKEEYGFTGGYTIVKDYVRGEEVRCREMFVPLTHAAGDGTNFHHQKRSNETHESTTDPDARLYRKSYGKESYLAYLGHVLVENRNGLIAAAMATQADGFAEREAALLMLEEKQKGRSRRITVGADKAYDSEDFVMAARKLKVTPHITKNDNGRRSNMDGRTTRHPGYALSLSCRWLVEKSFGWLKQTEPVRQVKLRGLHKVNCTFVFSCAAHNLKRLSRLLAQQSAEALGQQCA